MVPFTLEWFLPLWMWLACDANGIGGEWMAGLSTCARGLGAAPGSGASCALCPPCLCPWPLQDMLQGSPLLTPPHLLPQYQLLYQGFSLLPEITFYWELPKAFLGNQVICRGCGAEGTALRLWALVGLFLV